MDKEKIDSIAEKGAKSMNELYEKLPLDKVNEKLKAHNINVDVRSKKFKIIAAAAIVVIILILFVMIGGGDSIPHQDTVDSIIKDKREALGIEKVVSISYENVEEIAKNIYHTKAVIKLHGEITKDWAHAAASMGAKVGDTYDKTVLQDLVITYAGDNVEVEFGEDTEVK